jgi:hypothetical protein
MRSDSGHHSPAQELEDNLQHGNVMDTGSMDTNFVRRRRGRTSSIQVPPGGRQLIRDMN